MDKKKFGAYLTDLRCRNHVTQRQLGHYVGVSNQIISKWERGVTLPDAESILLLSRFFGITADALLDLRALESPPPSAQGSVPLSPLPEGKPSVRRTQRSETPARNLLPPLSAEITGDYFCTWAMQKEVALRHGMTGGHGTAQREALTWGDLCDGGSLYHTLPREVRGGLLFLVDDGWDVPLGAPSPYDNTKCYGSLVPDPEKFGGLGKDAVSKLRNLSERVKELGYAGLGLWIAAERAGNSPDETHRFYETHAKRHAAAGVRYWKVDWGDFSHDMNYRRILGEEVKKNAPDLWVEHCVPQRALSAYEREPDFFERRARETEEILPFSDVFRVYDVAPPFEEITVLARLHEALLLSRKIKTREGYRGLLSAEWCAVIAAALGCTLGMMKVTDEGCAALRFHRLSPPFGVSEADYRFREETLTDSLYYEADEQPWLSTAGRMLSETAPAVMARGCPLPEVSPCGEEPPFVLASRNPRTGVYAVATLARTVDPNLSRILPADVTLSVEGNTVTVGVFGFFHSLTLRFDRAIGDVRVLGQCLLSEKSEDMTTFISINGNELRIDGREIRRFGKRACLVTDRTVPMLLLRIEPKETSRKEEKS